MKVSMRTGEILKRGHAAEQLCTPRLAEEESLISRFRAVFCRRDDGGSMVEFALVLPMMMVLITGMCSFAMALNNYMVLTNAVGAGARAIALSRGQTIPALASSDPCAYAVQMANSSSPNLDQTKLSYTVVWTTTNSAGTVTSTSYSTSCAGVALNAGDTVQLKATYPFTPLVYGWKATVMNMGAQTAELVQ